MGITLYEKKLEKLSNIEREKELDIIRKYFLEDLISDEEIAKKMNLSKTAIINVRNKYHIKRDCFLKLKAKSKRDWEKHLTDLNHVITLDTFKTYEDCIEVDAYVSNISELVHDKLLSDKEIANELKLNQRVVKYLRDKYNIKRTKSESIEKQKQTVNSWTNEQKMINHNNRKNAMINRSIEEKQKTKNKIQKTMLERYGVTHNWQKLDIREKVKENSLKKYGVENPMCSIKSKETKIERYGDENYNNREKYKQTYSNFSDEKKLEIRKKTEQTCLNKYGVKHHMLNHEVKNNLQNKFLEKYNVACPFLINPNRNIISKNNLIFKEELFKKFNINFNMEININKHSYDFGYKNLLIELNPTVTHNSNISFAHLTGACTDENCLKHKPISKTYHYEKWKLAKENDYELISIFDWYNIDKILSLIKAKLNLNDNKLGARQTTVKLISKQESKKFLEDNHILGYDRSSDIIYGLYFNDLLVSVMSFGRPRYNKDYDWELLRFANLSNYTINGAASKLWKQFIKEYQPENVITYTNNDFGNGGVYEKLGFKFQKVINSSPVWNIPYKNVFIKHSSLIRQGADRLLKNKINNYFPVGLNYDDFIKRGGKEEYYKEYSMLPDDTDWWPGNIDIMRHYGFVEVYSTGTSIYVYSK